MGEMIKFNSMSTCIGLFYTYRFGYSIPSKFMLALHAVVWFGLVSLFNGISTFVGYLMPKLFSEKISSGTI